MVRVPGFQFGRFDLWIERKMENAKGDPNFISTMERRTSTLRRNQHNVPIRGAQTTRLDRAQLSRVF